MKRGYEDVPAALVIVSALALVLLSLGAAIKVTDGNGAMDDRETPEPQKSGVIVGADCGLLKRFAGQDDLEEYLKREQRYYGDIGLWEEGAPDTSGSLSLGGASAGKAVDFSRTNVQVAGVDEDDLVKTDGENLYVITRGDVDIVRAYPAEDAGIVGRVDAGGTARGLFLSEDRLVVISSWTSSPGYAYGGDWWGGYSQQTGLKVYDVSRPSSPGLLQSVRIPGGFFGARMIGDRVYFLVTNYLYGWEGGVVLPTMYVNGATRPLMATDIGYFDDDASAHTLLTVAAVDVTHGAGWAFDAYLIDSATNLYVSNDHIFVTAGSSVTAFGPTVLSLGDPLWGTTVHRVAIQAGHIRYACSGWAPGGVLNQFSMDEHRGYFRMVTSGWRQDSGQSSALYVFDDEMDLVGGLEGIAPGETLQSARFAGDRAYLVTFRRTDPFFVIDTSTPAEPVLLGELEVPGFSTYLHPYDGDHMIGLGVGQNGGVKLSLFDVTDVRNPREMWKTSVSGTYSSALYDHKAFLFSRAKSLLVIPVTESRSTAGGWHTWSGAYVFQVTLEGGFDLMGKVTHFDDATERSGYVYYSPYAIRRSLYIEENLYTVSDALVKINDLGTLRQVAVIGL